MNGNCQCPHCKSDNNIPVESNSEKQMYLCNTCEELFNEDTFEETWKELIQDLKSHYPIA